MTILTSRRSLLFMINTIHRYSSTTAVDFRFVSFCFFKLFIHFLQGLIRQHTVININTQFSFRPQFSSWVFFICSGGVLCTYKVCSRSKLESCLTFLVLRIQVVTNNIPIKWAIKFFVPNYWTGLSWWQLASSSYYKAIKGTGEYSGRKLRGREMKITVICFFIPQKPPPSHHQYLWWN